MLDCWKAEFWILPDATVIATGGASLNSVNLPFELFPDTSGGGNFLPLKMTFGGMMRNGLPVQLNTALLIQLDATLIGLQAEVFYLLSRTYWDPSLTDPMTP